MPFFAPAAFASTHFFGSFSWPMMNTQRNAGIAPTRNIDCQEFSPNGSNWRAASAPMPMPIRPAAMLPQVESDCSSPSAGARALSGTVSATSATESPNTPPTPSPVRKR